MLEVARLSDVPHDHGGGLSIHLPSNSVCLTKLWRQGHSDPAWPVGGNTAGIKSSDVSLSSAEGSAERSPNEGSSNEGSPAEGSANEGSSLNAWNRWIRGWAFSESIGWGKLRIIQCGVVPIGFVTLQTLDDTWLPNGVTAVAGGTYLVPSWRRRGVNRTAKQLAAQMAFVDLQSDWLIYAVPTHNIAALRSLHTMLPQLDAADPLSGALFTRWWRYLEWKYSQRFRLFGVHSKSADARHLLNPDGDCRHFIGQE